MENELFESCKTRTVTVKKPVKVKTVKQDGKKRIEEERIEYAEEQIVLPANVTAQIFWLKNRKKNVWSDKPRYQTVVDETLHDGLLDALSASAANAPPDDVENLPPEEDHADV